MTAYEMMKTVLQKDETVKIKLLGDSITHGSQGTGYEQDGEVIITGWRRNTKGYCWASLFKEHMELKYNCNVVNNGCSGIAIRHLLEHLDELVDADDDLIICTIGTNDRHRFFTECEDRPNREETMDYFYKELITLNDRLNGMGKRVIYVANIPASHNNEYNDGENYWRIIQMSDINNLYKRAEKELGITLISLYDLFLQRCESDGVFFETLLADGLHPNDDGYRVMYEILKESLGI